MRRAASAIGSGVPEDEVEARFVAEGCPPDQAKHYVIAGRQLYQQQEDSFFSRGGEVEKGISFASEKDCHVCQPFTRLVRDEKQLEACKAFAAPLGDLKNPRVMFKFLRSYLKQQDQEVFVVVCIDFRGALRDYAEVARGQRHRVAVDIEDITRIVRKSIGEANDAGSDGFVVAHCHPSGISEASEADGALTKSIREAADIALPTVHFLDHLVCGTGEFYSFAMNNWRDDGEVVKA